MSLNTLERAGLTVIGLAIRTKPMSPEIPALWPRFVPRIDEIPGTLEPRVSYGVMSFDESTGVLNYLAAVSVSGGAEVPDGMTRLELPAGTYASFRYPLNKLGEGFGEIYGRLLPASGYVQVAGQSFFERYDEKFDPAKPDSLVEIVMPVRRRS